MPLEMPKAEFRVSQPRLLERAQELHDVAVTYQSALTEYNVLAAEVAAFQTAINAALQVPNDEVVRLEITELNIAADEAEEEVRKAIEVIMGRARIVWGANSVQVRQFLTSDLAKQRRNNLMITANLVKVKANERFAELSAAGLTTAMVTALETATAAMFDAMEAVRTREEKRADDTRDRIVALNALKDTMVRISMTGKAAFINTDPVAYQAFMLDLDNDTPQEEPGTPVIEGVEGTTLTVTTSGSISSNEIQYSDNNLSWSEGQHFIGKTVTIEPPINGTRHYRVRSWNAAGVSGFSAGFAVQKAVHLPANLINVPTSAGNSGIARDNRPPERKRIMQNIVRRRAQADKRRVG